MAVMLSNELHSHSSGGAVWRGWGVGHAGFNLVLRPCQEKRLLSVHACGMSII